MDSDASACATQLDLERALKAALRALRRRDRPTASEQDAGTVRIRGLGEVQVFVKACRFDRELLKREPDSGGLLVNQVRGRRFLPRDFHRWEQAGHDRP